MQEVYEKRGNIFFLAPLEFAKARKAGEFALTCRRCPGEAAAAGGARQPNPSRQQFPVTFVVENLLGRIWLQVTGLTEVKGGLHGRAHLLGNLLGDQQPQERLAGLQNPFAADCVNLGSGGGWRERVCERGEERCETSSGKRAPRPGFRRAQAMAAAQPAETVRLAPLLMGPPTRWASRHCIRLPHHQAGPARGSTSTPMLSAGTSVGLSITSAVSERHLSHRS